MSDTNRPSSLSFRHLRRLHRQDVSPIELASLVAAPGKRRPKVWRWLSAAAALGLAAGLWWGIRPDVPPAPMAQAPRAAKPAEDDSQPRLETLDLRDDPTAKATPEPPPLAALAEATKERRPVLPGMMSMDRPGLVGALPSRPAPPRVPRLTLTSISRSSLEKPQSERAPHDR